MRTCVIQHSPFEARGCPTITAEPITPRRPRRRRPHFSNCVANVEAALPTLAGHAAAAVVVVVAFDDDGGVYDAWVAGVVHPAVCLDRPTRGR